MGSSVKARVLLRMFAQIMSLRPKYIADYVQNFQFFKVIQSFVHNMKFGSSP